MSQLLYNIEDHARLEYSRLLWKNPESRRRLLYVWEHPEHPHRERFEENRTLIVGLLECEDPERYVREVAGADQWSLRTLTREIPAIIGSLWTESKTLSEANRQADRQPLRPLRSFAAKNRSG